jgi:hypothetical protein
MLLSQPPRREISVVRSEIVGPRCLALKRRIAATSDDSSLGQIRRCSRRFALPPRENPVSESLTNTDPPQFNIALTKSESIF